MQNLKIVILGASGMLGSALLRSLSGELSQHQVWGTVRVGNSAEYMLRHLRSRIISGVNCESELDLRILFQKIRPDVIINCVGLIKQVPKAEDPIRAITLNSLLPHRLSQYCELAGARLIHISTDCVFSGRRGHYKESDIPDSEDLYGRSKLIGEVQTGSSVTLRTSIIGHGLTPNRSLIDWYLGQTGPVNGFVNAIFSGLPTVELARIVRDYVIPNASLTGLWHVSAEPVSKYDLLRLVRVAYGRDAAMVADYSEQPDRSLNSERFRKAVNYTPDSWSEMVVRMHADYQELQRELYS